MTGPIQTTQVVAVLEEVQEELINLLSHLEQPQRDILLYQLAQTAGVIVALRRRVARSEYEKARRGDLAAGLVKPQGGPHD